MIPQQTHPHFYPIPGTEGAVDAPIYTLFDLPLATDVLEQELMNQVVEVRPEYDFSGHPPVPVYPPSFYEAQQIAHEVAEHNDKILETAQRIENATRIVATIVLTGMAALLLFVFIDISGVAEINEYINNQQTHGK